ncbi:Panacea domain-containing protein [Tropicimonas sp. IMCC6043]|uniref:Panacea domain-containing protein n=1 Tax=Tropicimonas sp. IMCC6043 TaxID=2510645 RepID=UPI00101C10BF|nr:Panacea domain-containing protein [Tropicimonas sp. IMCC6043]RYH06459.1 DUF4065 domain-containing protein [Tropicimonas sp. IMCC6043]
MAYNARKAAQTIAYFALRSGANRIFMLKAIKLVYLADRESIGRYGFPIQDERHVSMPHGPVNLSTYEHVNGSYRTDATGWSEFLRDREDHMVALARDDITIDDLDELSDADLEVLDSVWEGFGHVPRWDLVKWTHNPANIPEWEDPDGSLASIPLQRIMNSVRVPNADAQVTAVEDASRIDDLFAAL